MNEMYIGLDIGGTNMVAGLTNGAGKIINKVSRPVNKGVGPGRAVPPVRPAGPAGGGGGGFAADQIKAVGLGLPGLVDNKTGYVIQTPNMPFDNTPIREMFQAGGTCPSIWATTLTAAIGSTGPARQDCDPAVVVTLGTGIGGGLVVGGKLYSGFAQSGLEVGHTIIRPNGVLCGCEGTGDAGSSTSATALIRIAQEAMSGTRRMWSCARGTASAWTDVSPSRPPGWGVSKEGAFLRGLSIGLINLVNILQPGDHLPGRRHQQRRGRPAAGPPAGSWCWRGCFGKSKPPRLERASPGQRRRSGRGCHAVQDAVRARLPGPRAAVEQEQGGLRRCGGRLLVEKASPVRNSATRRRRNKV